jgi:mono/diheme cytochrome c family protein
MIYRLLSTSLFTTLATERLSSIHELVPGRFLVRQTLAAQVKSLPVAPRPGQQPNRVGVFFTLAMLVALAMGLAGAGCFVAAAAQLFVPGAPPAPVAQVTPVVTPGVALPLDKKELLKAYARQHPGQAAAGKLVFHGKGCLGCHGEPGDGGGMGPDLAGVSDRYDSETVMQKILQPRPSSGMPLTFADQLTPEEFANVLAYLQTATAPVKDSAGSDQ